MGEEKLFKRLFLVNFLITLGFGIADAFFSIYLFSLGARGILLALPLVLYSASKVLLGPLMGAWGGRLGGIKGVAFSLALYLLVSVGYFVTSSLVVITVLRVVQGIGCAMFRPVVFGLVGRCSGGERRSTVMGTFDISFYAALSLGPLIGGVLKDCVGYRGIFASMVTVCLIALLAISYGAPLRNSDPVAAESVPAHARTPFRYLIGHRNLRGLLVFIFGRACGISLSTAFLPIVLSTQLRLSGIQTGMVMTASTLAVTLALRPVGLLSDRVPRKALVVVGGTVVSFLYFLIPSVPGFAQIFALVLGIGLFSALSQPASSALLVEEGSKLGMGMTVGTFNSVLNLGFMSGPLLGAGVQETFGLTAVFNLAGVLGLTTMALFVVNISSEHHVTVCEGNILDEGEKVAEDEALS